MILPFFLFFCRVLVGPGFESGVSRDREGNRGGGGGVGGGEGGADREGQDLELEVDDAFRKKRYCNGIC
jgi:hypothetical protein